jgi:hypothetical protein
MLMLMVMMMMMMMIFLALSCFPVPVAFFLAPAADRSSRHCSLLFCSSYHLSYSFLLSHQPDLMGYRHYHPV